MNPLAAELAKVSLWMEALEPGRPLTYLDGQIKVGNALVGATPALLADELPDAAFKPIEGDDKKIASAITKANKKNATARAACSGFTDALPTNAALADEVQQVVGRDALSLADVRPAATPAVLPGFTRVPQRPAHRRRLVCGIRVA